MDIPVIPFCRFSGQPLAKIDRFAIKAIELPVQHRIGNGIVERRLLAEIVDLSCCWGSFRSPLRNAAHLRGMIFANYDSRIEASQIVVNLTTRAIGHTP